MLLFLNVIELRIILYLYLLALLVLCLVRAGPAAGQAAQPSPATGAALT
jgi:hypothetical protein